jgi:2-dehydropantoate 2-reductase
VKIAVFGVGGVGGYFGGLLARAGVDTVFLARGEHLRHIREHGLRVESVAGDFEVKVRAEEKAEDVGPVDFILSCVKTYHVEESAPAMIPLLGPDTAVVSLQNGVQSEEKLGRAVGAGRVIGGAAYIESSISSPGGVSQTGGPRRLIIGELDGRLSERVRALRGALTGAGIDCRISGEINRELWRKFMFICPFSGLTSVVRAPIGVVLENGETRELYLQAMEEVRSAASSCGQDFPREVMEEIMDFTEGLHYDFKSSMQRDLERGEPLELDALNGHVAALGRDKGFPAPVNRFIASALAPYKSGGMSRGEG